MKNKDHKITEPIQEQGYKKKYIQRILEETETKKELEQWKKTKHDRDLEDREQA